jgi:hypothetical protein
MRFGMLTPCVEAVLHKCSAAAVLENNFIPEIGSSMFEIRCLVIIIA